MLRGTFELMAIMIAPAAAILAVWVTQRSNERTATKREESETDRLRERLSAERAERQLDALRTKRQSDVKRLRDWLVRFQAHLDAQYLEVTQLWRANPKVAEHICVARTSASASAGAWCDVVLIPISSDELRRTVRGIDKWGSNIANLPSIRQWLIAHPGAWDDAPWPSGGRCRPYLDVTEIGMTDSARWRG